MSSMLQSEIVIVIAGVILGYILVCFLSINFGIKQEERTSYIKREMERVTWNRELKEKQEEILKILGKMEDTLDELEDKLNIASSYFIK